MSTPKLKAFVFMPFAPEFNDIYTNFLLPVLQGNGFDVKRADDIENRHNILRAIIDGIDGSDLIIADVTGNKPNVFYELGLSHGLRTPTILITQNIDQIPFDLKVYKHLVYDRDFTKMEGAKRTLTEMVQTFHQGVPVLDSPVTDFLQHDAGTPNQIGSKEQYAREMIVRTFARTAVRRSLDSAVKATNAHDWYGHTGCFQAAMDAFDATWRELLGQDDIELSEVAALSILDAVLAGPQHELDRLGGRFAPDVLRHVRDNMEETLYHDLETIVDDTDAGEVWNTMRILVNHHLERKIPDHLIQVWREQVSGPGN